MCGHQLPDSSIMLSAPNNQAYQSLEVESGNSAAVPEQRDVEEVTPWFKKKKLLVVGLAMFLFFGFVTSGGGAAEDAAAATLGHKDPDGQFCCYYSTDKTDPCGSCKSKEDSSDWCSATEDKCLDCGGNFCPSPQPPPPPAADDGDDSDDAL